MPFFRGWMNTHKKELHSFASFRVPNKTEVSLFPRLLWIWAIQLVAACFGFNAKPPVLWWSVCILPTVTTAVLIADYFRERDCEIDGFFRYSSTFFFLLGFSMIELTVFIAIRQTVQNALIFSLAALLITFASLLYYIFRQIKRAHFSEKNKQVPGAAPYIAAALGYGTYRFLKNATSEKSESFFMIIVAGVLAGTVFGLAAVCWLKSVGAKQK